MKFDLDDLQKFAEEMYGKECLDKDWLDLRQTPHTIVIDYKYKCIVVFAKPISMEEFEQWLKENNNENK